MHKYYNINKEMLPKINILCLYYAIAFKNIVYIVKPTKYSIVNLVEGTHFLTPNSSNKILWNVL